MEIKNDSNKVKNFKKKDKNWVSIHPGESADLPECVLNNEEDVSAVEEPEKKAKKVAKTKPGKPSKPDEPAELASEEPAEDSVEESEDDIPKYSKSALKKLNEDEQVALLKRYGVDEETLKSLKTERKRVKYLLKLQGKKDEE